MFMGEYNHTIDPKGRVIVPAKFRDALGEHFVVTKGLDGCLFVYDEKEWTLFEEKLKTLPITNKEARAFVRFFLAGAAEVETDKQGRILLPSVLREYAELEKDVVLIGAGGRVEIWSKGRWDRTAQFDDVNEIAEHMLNLGFGI
ncbi:MAG: division/cell wall cluster transcriptional repressor MraZ [Lachnospiraceae bacterium]|nr:division/cell wall cluster transcriptional repressor MraZ [Lachnospiraceae bacterium]MCR4865386.1 division/cell wall cluster transcriptional repressor MraZ [Lachnospiraceae bacterium]